ncbi:Vesicle membrane receptor protein (v-SNARE) [Mucor velutinosus]|uniref:Vesicle membrane receptor protein (V-SNARE) n=1 Tax=Mucor velutinosus TaxID=708070 RepID=A0AAN7HYT2_9FUNG|nr:Vesicle membrane receptor protein (v-SNARE) [Mucor velutinosus]
MSLITLHAGRRWVAVVNRPLVAFHRAYTLIPSTPHPVASAATTENPVVKNHQEQDYNTIHALYNNENQSVHETTTHSYRSLSDDNETTFGPTFNSVFDE